MRLSGIKKLHIALICLLAALLAAAAVTMAWYGCDMAQLPRIGGSVTYLGKYFESGDGTADDPYIIAKPEQFYNLAWLQYLGYFNRPEEGTTTIPATYFELAVDIDMSDYTLPPIGTSDYPFLGNFDGNGNSIFGLTVTNKVDDTSGIPFEDLPYAVKDSNGVEGVEIIGLFGVVGALPGNNTYSYNSQANAVRNLYINGITVHTQTDQSLIGIVAGYVNGTVENVGVIGSTTINIKQATTPLAYTANMSDFSLVGYCTAAYKVQNNTVSTNGSLDESTDGSGGTGGMGTEWGGSIGMNTLFDRLKKVHTETASETARIDTYVSKEERTYNMFDNTVTVSIAEVTSVGGFNITIRYHDYGIDGAYAIGNTSYSYYDVSGHRIGVSGGNNKVTLNAVNAYWIFMENEESAQYLNRNGTAVTEAVIPTTMWALDANGHLYTVEPGTDTKYYLSVDTNGASIVSTPTEANQWTLEGDAVKVNGAAQYLSYDGAKWCLQTTGTYAKANSTVEYTTSVMQGRNSYLPINVKEDNFSVGENNTGYFVGGSSNSVGTVRVGSYGLSSLWKAFGKTSSSQTIDLENDELQVYTCTSKSVNESSEYEFGLINDPSALGLKKYDDALAQLEDILKNGGGYVYGLRFVQAEISKANLATASVVKINGKTMYNYEMPESCIDFQLAEKGEISFFAATVSGGPNYFFSLHEVIRNSDNTIKEIKKIQRIYQEGSIYIYEYDDGTFSGTKSEQAALAFDLDWIMSPNHADGSYKLHQNSVYYFEIPVNAGEYALGAHTRTGSTVGAYLLYLDIGANGDEGGGADSEPVETTMSATAQQYTYPLGVDFLAGETGLDGIQNSAAICLPGGTTGETSFTRADNTITVTSDTGNTPKASYIKDGITVQINGAEVTATPIEETVYLKKVTQTTGGVTTVSIYKGYSEAEINELVITFSYTAAGAAVDTSYVLGMSGGSTWSLDITVSNVTPTVTEVGSSGFIVTINGATASVAPPTG